VISSISTASSSALEVQSIAVRRCTRGPMCAPIPTDGKQIFRSLKLLTSSTEIHEHSAIARLTLGACFEDTGVTKYLVLVVSVSLCQPVTEHRYACTVTLSHRNVSLCVQLDLLQRDSTSTLDVYHISGSALTITVAAITQRCDVARAIANGRFTRHWPPKSYTVRPG